MGQERIIFFSEILKGLIANGVYYHLAACSIILILLLWQHRRTSQFSKSVVNYFRGISDSPIKAVLFILLFAFALYSLFALCFRFPYPAGVDEFGYLLTADTFFRGRLTNPTHPFWKHFEFFFIFQQPSYNSKYPVGQAAVLALGKLLTGYPIVGVWLSGATACAAVYWLLLAWFSSRWAFFGAIIAACNPIMLIWSQNYWGGYVAVIGGSLCLGAVPRIAAMQKVIDAVIFGVGAAVLCNSRPYEGFFFALLLGVFLFFYFLGKKDSRINPTEAVKKVLIPISLILILNFSWMAYYNHVVTGNFLKRPYVEYTERFDDVPLFLFQKMDKPIKFDNKLFATASYNTARDFYLPRTSGALSIVRTVLIRIILFYINYLLSPILLFFFALSLVGKNSDKKWLYLKVLLLLFMIVIILPVYFYPHFAAPSYGLFIILILGAAREMWYSENRQSIKRLVVLSIPVCLLTGVILLGIVTVTRRKNAVDTGKQRAEIEAALNGEGGKHLIFVDPYSPGSQIPDVENTNLFVYNEADIDNSKIVWAQQLNPQDDARLVDYFGNRKVWLLKLDKDGNPQLSSYQK